MRKLIWLAFIAGVGCTKSCDSDTSSDGTDEFSLDDEQAQAEEYDDLVAGTEIITLEKFFDGSLESSELMLALDSALNDWDSEESREELESATENFWDVLNIRDPRAGFYLELIQRLGCKNSKERALGYAMLAESCGSDEEEADTVCDREWNSALAHQGWLQEQLRQDIGETGLGILEDLRVQAMMAEEVLEENEPPRRAADNDEVYRQSYGRYLR